MIIYHEPIHQHHLEAGATVPCCSSWTFSRCGFENLEFLELLIITTVIMANIMKKDPKKTQELYLVPK